MIATGKATVWVSLMRDQSSNEDLRANAVMDVEHTGNTIETETIELILIHPESKVAQQKSENLMVSIVEQPAVPLVMATLAATMEVLVISTVKLVETIQDVL